MFLKLLIIGIFSALLLVCHPFQHTVSVSTISVGRTSVPCIFNREAKFPTFTFNELILVISSGPKLFDNI